MVSPTQVKTGQASCDTKRRPEGRRDEKYSPIALLNA